jgi:hypothetical protein
VLIPFCVNPGCIQEINERTVMSVMLGVVTGEAESKFDESLNLELLLQVCEICSCSFVLATKQIIEINWNLFVSFKHPIIIMKNYTIAVELIIMSGTLNRFGTVRSTIG